MNSTYVYCIYCIYIKIAKFQFSKEVYRIFILNNNKNKHIL